MIPVRRGTGRHVRRDRSAQPTQRPAPCVSEITFATSTTIGTGVRAGAWSTTSLVWQERLRPYRKQYGVVAADGSSKKLWRSWTGIRVPLVAGFVGSIEREIEDDSKPVVGAETTDTTLPLKLFHRW